MLVFVDETGSDCRDALRKYGYSLRGRPQRSCSLLARGERITAMNEDGIPAMRFVRGNVNGEEFLDSVERDLLPILMLFDGINPNSIERLDNCSVHHVPGVVSMIPEVGALLHFLPLYSPDMNPIEECFSKIKAQLKSMVITFEDDFETNILAAFSPVTSQNCKGWISDSKVYKY